MATWLLPALLSLAPDPSIVALDDVGPAALRLWSSNGGAIDAPTVDGQPVLRAAFAFTRPAEAEPIWVTRRLDPVVPRRDLAAVRFRYRFEVTSPAGATSAPLRLPGGFKLRLRYSPTAFYDLDVPAGAGGWPVGRWQEVALNVRDVLRRARNVYGQLFEEPDYREVTFRLEDSPETNAAGFLLVDALRFDLAAAAAAAPYVPRLEPRQSAPHLRVLAVLHGADGFYDVAEAARLLDPQAVVRAGRFRGLHFPIFGFPATRAEVLATDVIVLGDVDPYVLTPEQVGWLADAVRSGAGLLVCGGPQSLGQAQGQPAALTDLLPVTWEPAAVMQPANAPPAAGDHPALTGLDPNRLGRVGQLAAVAARPGAAVALTAAGRPLLVTGQADRGRVAVLTTWAQPRHLDDHAFLANAAWPPFAARLLAWLAGRDLPAWTAPPAPPQDPPVARWLYHQAAFEPGAPFGVVLRATPTDTPARVALLADGQEVWARDAVVRDTTTVTGTLPNLAAGPLLARVTLAGRTVAELPGRVVDPLRRTDFFPLISYLPTQEGGHSLDAAGVAAEVAELDEQGFNTVAVGGFGANAELGLGAQLRGLGVAAAASRGLAAILEYTNVTALRAAAPWSPSPFDPSFEAALQQRVATGLEQTRHVPRLLSVKFRDEPAVTPAHLDDSPATRAAFERLTGGPYVTRAQVGDDLAARYRYARFMSALLEQDFATGQRLKQAAGLPWDLVVTYYAAGFGGHRALDSYEDGLRWTRPADRFDFDVYPYFYPTSAQLRFVQADWGFAASRVHGRALGKPWGFYVELDDRNWPFQQNPAEASAECAWTAVAAGAEYLNSFITRLASTGSGARPERWAKAREAFRAIRRLGPALTRWKRQPARAAVLLAEAHSFVTNSYEPPLYTRALLAQALGDCDVLHEELLAAGPEPTLDLLALVGTSVLRRDAFDRLLAWVAGGGTVVLDRLAATDEAGRALPWPPAFAGVGERRHGNGWVVVVPEGWESRCRAAVEVAPTGGWAAAVSELERQLRPHLRPHPGVVDVTVEANRLQTDVGVRSDADSGLLLIVNHDPAPQRVTLRASGWAFRPAWVVDLLTGRSLPTAGDAVRFDAMVPGRGVACVGVFRGRPDAVSIAAPPRARRGELLRYRVAGNVPGAFLADLTVTAPDGRAHARLGGQRVLTGAVCEVTERLPDNVPPGAWTIRAVLPQTDATATATVEVLP